MSVEFLRSIPNHIFDNEIWNNERMLTFREAHLKRKYEKIERTEKLCSNCNYLWDPEADFRKYSKFVKKAIMRETLHFASVLKENKGLNLDNEKYKNLLIVLKKFTK